MVGLGKSWVFPGLDKVGFQFSSDEDVGDVENVFVLKIEGPIPRTYAVLSESDQYDAWIQGIRAARK